MGYGIALFIPYFLRSDLAGFDSYFYLAQACGNPIYSRTDLFTIIAGAFPCSIPIIKIAMGFFFILSLVIIHKTGKLFGNQNSGVLVLLSPLLLIEALKFEAEIFALPFLLLGTYLFFSEKKMFWSIIPLALGGLLWAGAFLYFLALYLPYSLVLAILLSILDPARFGIVHILPNFEILEGLPLMILGVMLLITGILNLPQKTKWTTRIFLLLGILQNKFLVHATPFLAIGLEKRLIEKFGKIPGWIYVIPFIYVIIIFTLPPTPGDWEAVDTAIQLHNLLDIPVKHDWNLGYLFRAKGYPTEVYGWPQEVDFSTPAVVVTSRIIKCPKYLETGGQNVYICK